MHGARLGLIAVLLLACAQPTGLWRDQYIFIGDEGTVLVFASHRRSNGNAHIKGWFGKDGRWQSNVFHEFSITGRQAHDGSGALAQLSSGPDAPARVRLYQGKKRVDVTMRLPRQRLGMRSVSMTELGTSNDPEGTSTYRAGRAQLWNDDMVLNGWLVSELTPADRPRRPFVDYGDFVFVIVASRDGTVLVKRSAGRAAFDHGWVLHKDSVRQTSKVVVTRTESSVELDLPGLAVGHTAAILDSRRGQGVAPDGAPVFYETLLLGGPAAGVAFTIRPLAKDSP